MPKKQTTKKRTQVKDLGKKGKQLSKGDMKNVKGGNLAPDATDDAELQSATRKPTNTLIDDELDLPVRLPKGF